MKTVKFLAFMALSVSLVFTACSRDDDDDNQPPVETPQAHPIVGTWVAYDVSPLLGGLGVDGITATFRGNNTYTVVSSAGSSETTFTGTYIASESANASGIFTITLNQSEPASGESQGIFQIFTASPDSMFYEVAQTVPAITGVTPPTASGGFGSTSSGAFGNANIQKYNRQP
ncbi:MAG: hypothetical protein ACXITV_04140 [Luteibaculaceae bacterium]